MTVTALIVAAGKGERLGGDVPKQFRLIGGKPVLRWAAEAMVGHPLIDQVRVVIGAGQRDLAEAALSNLPVGELIEGGAERSDSVLNGLLAIGEGTVLVHDAARPFCPPDVIDRLLGALEGCDGAVPVLAVADTLAKGVASLQEHRAYIEGLGNDFDPEEFLTSMAGFGGMAAGCDFAVLFRRFDV